MSDSLNNSTRLVDLIKLSTNFLSTKGIESARLEVEMMLCCILAIDRVSLYLNYDRPVDDIEKEQLRTMLRRRITSEPLQYILGYTEFYSLKLKVQPGVLIPRPETEMIVDLAKKYMPEGGYKTALDIGCGSGALGLSLLEEHISTSVVSVDISSEAIQVTLDNARSCGFETVDKPDHETDSYHLSKSKGEFKLTILKCDAFSVDFDPSNKPFDLIVSNPPYVTEPEFSELDTTVKDFEPEIALVSGYDGLTAHNAIAAYLPRLLSNSGLFLGEFGYRQGLEIRKLHSVWAGDSVTIHKDYNGHDRVIEGRLQNDSN
jgi:release factor glutamine methyltransferase